MAKWNASVGLQLTIDYDDIEADTKGLKLIEIANQLGIAEGTVRSWKNRYKWDDGGNATLQKKEKKERNVAKKIATQTNDASWVEIEHEYVTDISRKPCSLEDLARKYSIPIQTIKDQSATGKWSDKRAEYKLKTNQKLIEKSSDADADRIVRLLSIADKAAEKAEQALGELEQYVVRDKKKVKTVEYKDNTAIGKPTKEIIAKTYALKDSLTKQGVLDPDYLIYKAGGLEKFNFDKEGKPIGVEEVVKPYKDDAAMAHLFKQEQQKPPYNPKNGGAGGVTNPFAKDTFNLTEQGRMLKENPAQAKELAAAAGVTL